MRPMATNLGSRNQGGITRRVNAAVGSSLASRPNKEACGRIWPNGEFGLSYVSKVTEREPHRPVKAGGVSLSRMREECLELVGEAEAPLDLTSLPNSHTRTNRPETYGRKGLTGYGAKMIRNAAYLLEREVGRKYLTFMTLTLPPMDEQDARLVAASWGETVRQLTQWLVRRLTREGLDGRVALVTELQSQRLESGDSACLHVHAVFQGRKRGKTWAISVKDMRSWWLRRLNRVTEGTVKSLSCCDMKRVEKSAANYLSKYMSKGADDIEKYASAVGWDAVPRQWWSVSKSARDAVKRGCLTGRGALAVLDELVCMWYRGQADDSFKFVRMIEIRATELQSFVVGYFGMLRPDTLLDIKEMCATLNQA